MDDSLIVTITEEEPSPEKGDGGDKIVLIIAILAGGVGTTGAGILGAFWYFRIRKKHEKSTEKN